MTAGPGAIEVGPALRESVAIALRHWWVFLFSGVALGAGWLGFMAALGWCLFGSDCYFPGAFDIIVEQIGFIPGAVNRLLGWPIMAWALYHVLMVERRRYDASPPRRRLVPYVWCFSYFVAITAVSALINSIVSIPWTLHSVLAWSEVGFIGVIASALWSYIDAHFAVFLTATMFAGGTAGFMKSWARTSGNKRRVLLVFFTIEVALFAADFFFRHTGSVINYYTLAQWVADITLLPSELLSVRLRQFVESVLYVTVSNMFCAGAFIAIHRQLTAALDGAAAVFD
jgi:hypothetical protein